METSNKYNSRLGMLEFNRFGLTAFTLTVQSCVGALAAHAILQLPDHLITIPLTLVTILVMIANSFVIAQTPMKWTMRAFYGSLLVSIITLVSSWIYLLS